MSISSLSPHLRNAFHAFQKHVLAVEAFGLYNKYKFSADVHITLKVQKLFYTVELKPQSQAASKRLKIQAKLLAPKLGNRPELQDPCWAVSFMQFTTFLWVDPGISLYLIDKNGKKCIIRTTRISDHIKYETEEGMDWHHHPDQPEPWMK